MTKSEIIKQVEEKKRQAFRAIDEEFDKKIEERIEEVHKELKLDEYLPVLQEYVDKANQVANYLKDLAQNKGHTVYNGSYGLFYDLRYYESNLRDSVLERIDPNDNELLRIKSMRESQIDNVRKAYNSVITNLKSMSSAKRCITYLESLEFDITGMLTESVKGASVPAVIVDTTYLFVK